MLISYNHFYITKFFNNLCSIDVSGSVNSNTNSPLITSFDKNFIFSFYNSSRLAYEVKKYQKLICCHPKVVVILVIRYKLCPSFHNSAVF